MRYVDTIIEDSAEHCSYFADFCGPRSLALALDLSRGTTARLLLGVMRQRRVVEVPGTSEETMLLALSVLNVRVETYHPSTGSRLETEDQCMSRARDTVPKQLVDVPQLLGQLFEFLAATPEDSRPAMLEELRNRFKESLRLCDWSSQGTWLVCVEASPLMTHWIALRDGAVLRPSDDDYRERRICKALRVWT